MRIPSFTGAVVLTLPEWFRRVTYALADPRYLAAAAIGREPTDDEWRELIALN